MYLKQQRASGALSHDILARSLTELDAAGVKTPTPIREAITTATERLDRITTMRAHLQPDELAERAAAALAAGEGTEADVLAAANAKLTSATTITVRGHSGPLADVFRRAVDKINRQACDSITPHGDKLVRAMRPVIEAAAAKIVAAVPSTFEFAIGRGNTRALDWILKDPRLSDEWSTMQTLYSIARVFRQFGLIDSTNRRDDWYEFAGQAEDEVRQVVMDERRYNVRDNLENGNVTSLLWAHRAGLRPTLLTEAEVAAADGTAQASVDEDDAA